MANTPDSAHVATFHSLMQSLADVHEKPVSRPLKKEAKANDSQTTDIPAPAKERKPPLTWNLPQAFTQPQDTDSQLAGSSPASAPQEQTTPTSQPEQVISKLPFSAQQLPASQPSQPIPPTRAASVMAATAKPDTRTHRKTDGPAADAKEAKTPETPQAIVATLHASSEIQIQTNQRMANPPKATDGNATSRSHSSRVEAAANGRPENQPDPATGGSDAHGSDTPRSNRIVADQSQQFNASQVAFEARLRPVTPEQAISQPKDSEPEMPASGHSAPEPQAVSTAVVPHVGASRSPEQQSDDRRDPQERQPKDGAATVDRPGAPTPQLEVPASVAVSVQAASMTAPAAASHTAPAATPTPSHTPTPTAQPETAPDPAPAPAAAHDIRIAVNDNGQRVELRVTERAGDIHVAVRTPDSQLATSLRNDLPALSGKLEQSGFHSEMWRPAAAPSGENKIIETSSGKSSSDSREHSGGGRQGEESQQNQKNPQQQFNRKSDRKEFSWLFQSIR